MTPEIFATGTIIKVTLCAIFGAWSPAYQTLLIMQIVDTLAGSVTAIIFKKSPKSKSGAFSSDQWRKGIWKKFFSWAIIGVCYQLDITMGTDYLKDIFVTATIVQEATSLFEKWGVCGGYMPEPITKALDVLRRKESNG